ncbi:MAG TPA: response regulator [Chthoniobacteraceae bacterium]|nr:response regulator [Chthoniobacteraceae bacterium]
MENEVEILVADDEPAVALAIKSALRFCGYAVQTAGGGEEALKLIREHPGRFALLITDHNMPQLGGLALVRALRASDFPGRIMILSGFLSSAVEREYEGLGVDQILAKPFTVVRLREAVERAVHPAGCGA